MPCEVAARAKHLAAVLARKLLHRLLAARAPTHVPVQVLDLAEADRALLPRLQVLFAVGGQIAPRGAGVPAQVTRVHLGWKIMSCR